MPIFKTSPLKFFLFIIGFFLRECFSATTLPTWMFNEYFQTYPAAIKTNFLTSFNASKPITATFKFVKTYNAIPQFAFGIKNYRGKDRLVEQNFAIRIISINTTQFKLYTAITGYTNLRILSLQYLAVNRDFPYHLNTFNNIDANFSRGALTNISGTQRGNRFYLNTINYTVLAGTVGSSYTKFGSNLAKNYVGMYLCAIFNKGTMGATQFVKYTVQTQILNVQQFNIKVTILDGYQIDLLKFSMVIMDVHEIQSGGKFTIQFQYIVLNGGIYNYIPIPKQFAPATFIGLLDFSAQKADCGLEFNWELDLPNNQIIVNSSIVNRSSTSAVCGLSQYRVTVFYVKTWACNTPFIFFNLSTNLCQDECGNYFYENYTFKSCDPCQLGCLQCQNGPLLGCTQCIPNISRQLVGSSCQCISGYYTSTPLDRTSTCIPCQTHQDYCLDCNINSGIFQCLSCQPGYSLVNNTCIQCWIQNCQVSVYFNNDCQQCTLCLPGFTFGNSTLCENCSDFIDDCLQCKDMFNCTLCQLPFYANQSSGLCEQCQLLNCITCATLTTCLQCDQLAGYFLNTTTGQCQQCSLDECIKCSSLTTCEQCNTTNNYFLNIYTLKCQQCDQVGCEVCKNLTSCYSCNQSEEYVMNLDTQSCYLCDRQLSMFFNIINGTDGQCDHCNLTECIYCASLQECQICNVMNQYFLNNQTFLCEPCAVQGCLKCDTLQTCIKCDQQNQYTLLQSQLCVICSVNCTCGGYVQPIYQHPQGGQFCSTVCGDTLVRNFQACDDGNLINGDGCSDQCLIEDGWVCGYSTEDSCCNIDQTVLEVNVIKMEKIVNANSIYLEFQFKPLLSIFSQQNLMQYVSLSVTGVPLLPLYNIRKLSVGPFKLGFILDYKTSIHGQNGFVTLTFLTGPQGLPSCLQFLIQKTIPIYLTANNNIPMVFYQQQDYIKHENIEQSVKAAEIITYIVLFTSLLTGKIVGLQLVGVLQLSYFVLAQQQNVNILLEPFMRLNSMNGMNFNIVKDNQNDMPDSISSLGIKALFLNNCNVMLALIWGEVIVAGILYFSSNLIKNYAKKFSKISKYLIKEGLLTLMMFNCFNIAFGVGIHFEYADQDSPDYLLSTLAALSAMGLLIVTCGLIMFANAKQFGQFKSKFKSELICQLYFVFSLTYRFSLGYYVAVQSQYTLSSLIVIGISFMYLAYNLINLPFKDAYQNYRANVCHVNQLIILFVTNYYDSMKENDPLDQKAYQYDAAYIQVVTIYITIGVSSLCLGVQVYKFVKSLLKPSTVKNTSKLKEQIMKQSAFKIQETNQNIVENKNQQNNFY